MTRRDIFFKIAFYIIISIIFLVCAAIVVLFSMGYKVDIKNREISQTGIIAVKTDDNLGEIYLNAQSRGVGRIILRNLNPGFYDVEIRKENYQTFKYSFYLNSGEAKIIDNVVLFLEKPAISKFEESREIIFSRLSDTTDILISNNELYLNDKFLTRFENKINDACWYPNERFIGVTTENKFKIIDIETLNIFDLFEKKSSEPVVFINSGRSVLFESDNILYTAKIR